MNRCKAVLFLMGIVSFIIASQSFAEPVGKDQKFSLEVKDKLISLQAANASFKEILRELEEKTGIKVKIFEGVKDKRVSLNVQSLPVYAASNILQKMSLKNFGVVFDNQLGSVAIYVLPEGKDISEVIKGKTVIRQATFATGKTIDVIKGRKIVSTTNGRNEIRIRYVKDEILLKFHLGVSDDEIREILERHNLVKFNDSSLSKIGYIKARIPDGRNVITVIKEIRKEHKIKVPEPNYVSNVLTISDPLYDLQWYIPHTNFDKTWERTKSKNTIKVAVIDSGVDADHPDLKGKILAGYDFVNEDTDASDDHGHGTFIAGIIAANSNHVGIKGLYDHAQIFPIKAVDENGLGTYENVAKGILFAADNGAKVINLSLGSYSYSFMLLEAVDYALERGCIIVAAGGNDGLEQVMYPAGYPDVIGVSALGYNGEISQASNSGSHIDVSAPGVNLISTGLGESYVYATGTSASASMVSALAAMLVSEKPDLSKSSIKWLIIQSAKDLGEKGWDKICGSGEIDAFSALEQGVKRFHDVAVRSAYIEPMVFEKGKPTYIVANIENRGTYHSDNCDVVLYRVAGEKRIELGKKVAVNVVAKRQIVFEWEPEILTEGFSFEIWTLLKNDVDISNNSKTTCSLYLEESQGLHVLHAVEVPVHQWVAYQASKIWSNAEIMEYMEEEQYNDFNGQEVWDYQDIFLDDEGYCDGSPGCDDYLGRAEGILVGAGEEDTDETGSDSCMEYGIRNPFCYHFWDPDSPQNGDYDNGLAFYGSAYVRAEKLYSWASLLYYDNQKEEAYYWLGRVAHLLTDMTVPAHVHLDPHAGALGGDEAFEEFMKLKGYWGDVSGKYNYKHFDGSDYVGQQYDYEALPYWSSEVKNNPTNLFKLFWFTAQKTQYFASDDWDSISNDSFVGDYNNYFAKEDESTWYFPGGYSNTYLWDSEGGGSIIVNDKDDIEDDGNQGPNLAKIAEANIPHAMKAVAGLYRLFWHETLHAPSNVSASDGAYSDKIRISWIDNSSVEDGFKIYRSTSENGQYIHIGTKGADATLYYDFHNCGGTTYWYIVRAYNAKGEVESEKDSGYTNDCLHACSDMSRSGTDWDDDGSSPNDGDGVMEAGERPTLMVRLRSTGGAKNVDATLSTDDADINFTDSDVDYDDFTPGESKWSVGDFSMQLNFSLPSCDVTRTSWFTLHVTYELNGEQCYQDIPFSKIFYKNGCRSADFSANGPVIIDDDPSYHYRNDGDGVFESGEWIHVQPQVCNVGTSDATHVDVEIYYSGHGDPPVEFQSGDERYEDLAAGGCGYPSSGNYFYVEASNKSFTGLVDIGIRVDWDENNLANPIEIPDAFQVYVHPAPAISVTRDYYFGTVCTCEPVATTAQVHNGGSSVLTVHGIEASHADTSVNPSGSFTLEAGQSREIVVTIDTCGIEDGTEVVRTITVNSDGKLSDNTPPSNIFVMTGLVSCPGPTHRVPGVSGAEDPDVSGDWIVYKDHRNGNSDVFAYQISSDNETRITTNTDVQTYPRIHGNLIVWNDWRNDDGSRSNCDIYGYDLNLQQEFIVSNQPSMEELIGVDGKRIAFTRRYEVLYDGDGTLGGRASNLVVHEYMGNRQTEELYSTSWTPGSGYEVRPTVDDDGDFGDGMLVFERYAWTWLDQYQNWSMSAGGQWVEVIDFAKGETTPRWAKDKFSSYYSAAEHRFVFQKEYEDPQGNDGEQVWLWDDGSVRRLTEPGTQEVDHAYNVLAMGGDFVVYDKSEAVDRNKLFYWDLGANQAEYPEFLLTDQESNSLQEARMDGSAVVWRSLGPSDGQWYIYYAFLGKRITFSPSSVAFGTLFMGDSSERSVAITNIGNEDLQIGNIAQNDPLDPDGPFTVLNDSCSGQIISPGEICLFTVRFSPTDGGPFDDSFDIPSDDPNNNPIIVNVSGTVICEKGDVDGNGGVDLADAIIGLKTMAGMQLTSVHTCADVSDDSEIGLQEVVYILQKVSGLR